MSQCPAIFKPTILMTESKEEFAALQAALSEEIRPRTIVEKLFVADFGTITWELLRLRRCKDGLINRAVGQVTGQRIRSILGSPESALFKEHDSFVRSWFNKPMADRAVAEIAAKFALDPWAIEAEAISSISEELETIDRMIAMQEARRAQALRMLAEYRDFAAKARAASLRIVQLYGTRQVPNQPERS